MISPEIETKISEIINNLKAEILNEENLLKAGTEFELNMDQDYQQTIGKKFINLRRQLNSLDTGNKDKFSIDDFYKFFSSKNPGVKKEDIKSLLELTDHQRNLENKITVNEFVSKYILLEEKIKLKKNDLSRITNQQRKKIEKYQDKLKEYEREEYFSQGISKQNEFSIEIIKIVNLQGINRCKIILYLMNKSGEILDEKETRTVADPKMEFKEIFSFQVTDDQCYIKCVLSDSDTLINEGHGYFIIELVDYFDQMRREKDYDIIGEQNNAKVYVSCIFSFNNKKKYTDLISKVSQEIDSLNQIIFQLDTIIDKTNEPFGLIYYNKIKEIKDKNFLGKLNVSEDLSNSRISIYSIPRDTKKSNQESPYKMRFSGEDDITRTKIKEGLGSIPEEGSDAMNSNLLKNEIKSTEGYLPENFNRYIPKSTFLGKKSTQLIIFGILVSLVSFLSGKFDVLNFVLFIFGLMMAYNVVNINGRLDTMRYFFYALLIVIAFDTFWILFLNREQNIESSFWRIIVFGLTIVSIIIKIVLSYLIRNRRR